MTWLKVSLICLTLVLVPFFHGFMERSVNPAIQEYRQELKQWL